jgi:glycosyltransferase involved in cell wall biosynthesis
MKLGIIVRADNGGLGVQTLELARHLNPAKVLIMDISGYNGAQNYFERYDFCPDRRIHKSQVAEELLTRQVIDEWIDGLDVVFTCEIPYNYYLFEACRAKGIKTVLQYNWEFLDYTRQPALTKPDLFLSPGQWHMNEMLEMFPNTKYIPVPINRKVCPYREVKQAKTFVHVAGVKLYEDRNGTEIVLRAIPLVQSDVKFIIYTQHEIEPELLTLVQDDLRVEVRSENLSYGECWAEGDVSILPRRYGGLSLQLNEAMSSGMIPICTDIEPQNTFLHHMSLIATCGSKKVMTRGTEIDCYDVDPAVLAKKIDRLSELPEESIIELNKFYNDLAESISWEKMTPVYLNTLERL